MFVVATAQNNQLVAVGNARDIIKIFFIDRQEQRIHCMAVMCLHQNFQLYSSEKILHLLDMLYPIERIAGPVETWQKYHGWNWPEHIVKYEDVAKFEVDHNNKGDFSLLRPVEQEKR